jgi:hypothetical protein
LHVRPVPQTKPRQELRLQPKHAPRPSWLDRWAHGPAPCGSGAARDGSPGRQTATARALSCQPHQAPAQLGGHAVGWPHHVRSKAAPTAAGNLVRPPSPLTRLRL